MKRVFKNGLSFIAVLSLLTLMGCPASSDDNPTPAKAVATWNGDGEKSSAAVVGGDAVTLTTEQKAAISALSFTFTEGGTYTMKNPNNAVLPTGISASGEFTTTDGKFTFKSVTGEVVSGDPFSGTFTLVFEDTKTVTTARQVTTKYTYAFNKQ